MTLWQCLRENASCLNGPLRDELAGDALLLEVEKMAQREKRTPDEVILVLLNQALEICRQSDHAHHHWEALSAREKQIAALICAELTNRQIAARLVISPETVKTHVRHILRKFGSRSRRDLCLQLNRCGFAGDIDTA